MLLRRVGAVVIGCLLIATGCQVDATTTVTMAEDGRGTVMVEVELDGEAFERVDDLDAQLRTADLEASGWQVEGPEPTADGGRRIVVTKPFADPDQAAMVLAEITGPDKILTGAAVQRSKQFGRVEQSFEATLDLSGGIEAFGDDELTALLNDLPIGQDVAALEEDLGAPLADLTSFTVIADLPAGDVSSAGDPDIVETDDRVVFEWAGSLGDPSRELRAQTRVVDWLVIGLAVLAIVTGLILVVMLLRRALARRRPTAVAADS